MEEQHLLSICEDENPSFYNNDSSDNDSSVESTSTIDKCENEVISLLRNLQFESENDNYDDDQT